MYNSTNLQTKSKSTIDTKTHIIMYIINYVWVRTLINYFYSLLLFSEFRTTNVFIGDFFHFYLHILSQDQQLPFCPHFMSSLSIFSLYLNSGLPKDIFVSM